MRETKQKEGECRMKNLPITVEALRPVAGVKIMK